ncbi:MAG: hypothetical protein LWW85_02600 [Marinilabiliales bacterium]|nr:hypothetical protein [Marinilabiliales bacterium]
MKAATLKEIRTELGTLHQRRLEELCLKLIRYKKENKELMTYLLFEAADEWNFVRSVKEDLDRMFDETKKGSSYQQKKQIRKILTEANRFIRYSGVKQTEVEIRIHFCKKLRKTGIPLHVNTTLGNLYFRQVLTLRKLVASLHEDLQFDYSEELERL